MSIKEVIPENEDERLKALLSYDILDSGVEEEFERINELASLISGSEMCLISFIDRERQWFKSKIGMETSFTPRKLTFCQYTILQDDLLEVPNALEDSRFRNSQFVTGEPFIRFYAGQPIVDDRGNALGTICIFDSTPRKLSDHQIRSLKLLADECMLLVKERLRKKELNYIKEILERCNRIAKIGTWELDMESKSMYWSKITRELHGVDLSYEPKWDNGIEFLTNEKDKEEFKNLTAGAIQCRDSFDREFELTTAQGYKRWIRITGAPLYEGEICRKIHGTYQDITDKKSLEFALIEAKENAESGSRSKSEFLANMSHEIRTPLNGVIGFIDLLMRTPLEDYQEDYMRIISQSAHHLMDLINDILDFSKIEAGKLDLHPEPVIMELFWKQAQDIIAFKAKEKDLEFKVEISPDIPKQLLFDSLRLKQVIINLFSNAIKFTSEGYILFRVENLSEPKSAHCQLRISVIDSGIGIPLDKQSSIMDAFSQADSSTTRKYGGTGLGLTISNSILSMMNSKLELASESGKGSCFSFTVKFPVADTEIESPKPVIIDKPIKKALRILIAEDNDLNLLLTKTFLQKINQNFEIFVAKDGKEAWEIFQRQELDLILMDIQMPLWNGLEATKVIRGHENGKNIPIIALTAGTYADELDACRNSGMNDVITKPVVQKTLRDMIAKYFTN